VPNVRTMSTSLIVVEGVVPVAESELDDVPNQIWAYAMDQRVFGPRKLLVVFTDVAGRLHVLAHANRTDRPLLAFEACLDYLGAGSAAAVALCDEPVEPGPMSVELLERFAEARIRAEGYGVHLVDWIACDDDAFRAVRLLTLTPSEQPDWWDVPGS
jgi:hypothetical protein